MSGQTLTSINGINATSVYNALVPREGPKSVFTLLDFTSSDVVNIDFTLAGQEGKITAIQSIWADNSQSSGPLTIDVAGTGQRIVVPAGYQGTIPVIAATRPKMRCTCAAVTRVGVVWLNVPMPVGVWNTGAALPKGADAYIVTTGGVPVVAFATATANAYITNPNTATESLWVDPVNAAGLVSPGVNGTTTELVAGQSYAPPTGARISVNAATSGHAFVAVA